MQTRGINKSILQLFEARGFTTNGRENKTQMNKH
jgi:hypothetical protein